MSIAIKVRRVQKVFDTLEEEVSQLKQHTGIRCLSGCGQCCTKPDIEASVLEFIPLAFELFLQRKSREFKEQLLSSHSPTCTLFQLNVLQVMGHYTAGQCTAYKHRGLICRLFGYASVRDKQGAKRLSTCKLLKTAYAETIDQLHHSGNINAIPNFTNYYQKLVQIDFRLGQEFHPINKALVRAIEEVEAYYQYRHFPYRLRRSS